MTTVHGADHHVASFVGDGDQRADRVVGHEDEQ
jgi:hypothetical protein